MAAGNINPTHLKFSFSFKTTTRVSIRHYFDHIRLLRSDYTPVSRLAARSILWSRCRLPGAWPHPACAVQCPAPGRGCFNEAGPGMAGHANNTTVEVWHSPDPNYWDLTLRDLTSGEHQDSGIRWGPSSEEPSDQQPCVFQVWPLMRSLRRRYRSRANSMKMSFVHYDYTPALQVKS